MEDIIESLMEECCVLEYQIDKIDLIIVKTQNENVKKVMKELMENMLSQIKIIDKRIEMIQKFIG